VSGAALGRRLGEAFPWGTIAVNLSGAFAIGIVGAGAHDGATWLARPEIWLGTVTGFLGCYTTVSALSLQTVALARGGESGRAALNLLLTLTLGLGAAAAGMALGTAIARP
jgi:CrcB protein